MRKVELRNGRTVGLIEGDSHISKWVEMEGRLDHDQNMLPLLNAYIHKGFTVLDVGGYIGDHTEYYVERVGRTGKVYAFEPNPKAFECLEFNMRDHKNVLCLNVGASEKEHSISLAQDANGGAAYAIEGDDFKCITIDSLGLDACDFIKMDCEGFELNALKGASETVAKFRPTMLIEINNGALLRQGVNVSYVFDWMAANGYSYRNIYSEQAMDDAQFDILCQPINS